MKMFSGVGIKYERTLAWRECQLCLTRKCNLYLELTFLQKSYVKDFTDLSCNNISFLKKNSITETGVAKTAASKPCGNRKSYFLPNGSAVSCL